MPRRPRRAGTNYIDRDSERAITLTKRRNGLFKIATELSILTGAKSALAIECESGKMFAFGTPSPGPVIDSFLSGDVTENIIPNDEAQNVIDLQNELIRLKNLKDTQDRRMQESMSRSRQIQDRSNTAKLIYGNIDDLSVDELNELQYGLSRVDQEIQDRLPPSLKRGHQLETCGSEDPSSYRSASSHY